MTDNDIIKALECCNNEGCCDEKCPYYTKRFKGKVNCLDKKEGLIAKALDLINRQKAEIEELRKGFTGTMEDFASEYDSKIKTEAYKEFAERAIQKICETVSAPTPEESRVVEKCNETIYSLLAEMESERE